MRPAFASTKQAAVFAALLLALLLSPVLVGKTFLPAREQAYATLGWNNGAYPWVHDQIFAETNDIDIALVGSSHIWQAVNTPYLQQKLGEQLHRPAVVRTIAWGGGGYDALFFMTRDLLAHRQVRLLVFYDEGDGLRNPAATVWFRWSEDAAALSGLALADQAQFYFASIIGLPRNALARLRPNLPAPLVTDRPNFWTLTGNQTPNPAMQLGCLSLRLGFTPDDATPRLSFVPQVPVTTARAEDAVVYAAATRTAFEFSAAPLPAHAAHFVRSLDELFRQHGVQPVMLYLPALAEVRSPVIGERTFWPDILTNTVLLGIPPAKCFGDLTDAGVLNIFADRWHFNANGQAYFTQLIAPALINLYEKKCLH